MLAGVADQTVAQVTQAFLGAQTVIDVEPTAAAFGQKFAAQDQILFRLTEQGFYLGAFGPWAHHVRRQSVAQQKTQGFKNKALAGPGFTSQHVHAGGKFQLHVLNEGQVANAQIFQHGRFRGLTF